MGAPAEAADTMEVFQTKENYILLSDDTAVLCSRISASLSAHCGSGRQLVRKYGADAACIGCCEALVGKLRYDTDEFHLVLVTRSEQVMQYPTGGSIRKISKIASIPLSLSEPTELQLKACRLHPRPAAERLLGGLDERRALGKAFKHIRTAAENVNLRRRDLLPGKERMTRKVMEEVSRVFCDGCYFSLDGADVTQTLQQQSSELYASDLPPYRRCHADFFWNQAMLADLIAEADAGSASAAAAIVPMAQGFMASEELQLDPSERRDPVCVQLSLLSRRSKQRAGTRFKKRGVDDQGHVANFVVTEQLMVIRHSTPHFVSFVQLRGSVPLFWSQSGLRYKPPPKLERSDEENRNCLERHFYRLVGEFGRLAVVSLVDTAPGRSESIIASEFLKQVVAFNCPDLTFLQFDFHEYCRQMRFENISMLLDGVTGLLRDMGFCWVDKKGVICEQKSFFRVNCIDCLDRTNVVQTAFARLVMETQLRKVGLLYPEDSLPASLQAVFQGLWANNGDSMSQQYAGTSALKGDLTRTGRRTLNGLVTDGVNSANRYYLRFNELTRQTAIECTLGLHTCPDLAEEIKALVEQTMPLGDKEKCIGSWPLILSEEAKSDETEMNCVLYLSSACAYVIRLADKEESQLQCVPIAEISDVQLGPETHLLKGRLQPCMRLTYRQRFHFTFRVPGKRLFNNMVISVANDEDAMDSLKAVSESFRIAGELNGHDVKVWEVDKVPRKKGPAHPAETFCGRKEPELQPPEESTATRADLPHERRDDMSFLPACGIVSRSQASLDCTDGTSLEDEVVTQVGELGLVGLRAERLSKVLTADKSPTHFSFGLSPPPLSLKMASSDSDLRSASGSSVGHLSDSGQGPQSPLPKSPGVRPNRIVLPKIDESLPLRLVERLSLRQLQSEAQLKEMLAGAGVRDCRTAYLLF